jgi:hypothetical protein
MFSRYVSTFLEHVYNGPSSADRRPSFVFIALSHKLLILLRFNITCVAIVCNWSQLPGHIYSMRMILTLVADNGVHWSYVP